MTSVLGVLGVLGVGTVDTGVGSTAVAAVSPSMRGLLRRAVIELRVQRITWLRRRIGVRVVLVRVVLVRVVLVRVVLVRVVLVRVVHVRGVTRAVRRFSSRSASWRVRRVWLLRRHWSRDRSEFPAAASFVPGRVDPRAYCIDYETGTGAYHPHRVNPTLGSTPRAEQ
jgi:hypothetical protein